VRLKASSLTHGSESCGTDFYSSLLEPAADLRFWRRLAFSQPFLPRRVKSERDLEGGVVMYFSTKLTRLLGYLSLLVFPLIPAGIVGLIGQSATLGVKTFLLAALGVAVFSPLLNALIASGEKAHHHNRGK
jgi:hypothetical protein